MPATAPATSATPSPAPRVRVCNVLVTDEDTADKMIEILNDESTASSSAINEPRPSARDL